MGLKENIKAKRLENGMTLEELANKIGITKQTVQKYESGLISNIPSNKIEKLAGALHTTPAYLMGWEVDEKNAFDAKNVRCFDKTLKHIRELNHLSEIELENKLHLPSGTINRLENSESAPTDELLYLLADFFNISINSLLDDHDGTIFRRIKNIINYHKLTIDEFVDSLYIVRDLYDNWENNVSKSYINFLDLIAKTFNAPIGYLWGDFDEERYSGEEFNFIKITDFNEKKIIENFRALNEIGKEEALKRIEELTFISKYTEG